MADDSQQAEDIAIVKRWLATKKVTAATADIIIELGFSSLEALECLTGDDVKKCASLSVEPGDRSTGT
jgi:hypothetical protein